MLNTSVIKTMDDEQFKNRHNEANSQMPPEFKVSMALLSESYDEDTTTATAGLAIVTVDSNKFIEEYGFDGGAFIEQPRMEVALNESLSEILVGNVKVSGFSFGLLFGDEGEDFHKKLVVYLLKLFNHSRVLSYIFFMKGRSFNRKPLDVLRRLQQFH